MPTPPIPTGKIRGSLKDVTQKLQNFVGAVKVTTSSGKGGILVNMGRPVAAYLAHEGVLHRGKDSLGILEKETLAEFEIIRYDEEQFREAMIICENRGLLLEGEKVPEKVPPGREPAPAREAAREAGSRGEENVLSAMMKRFAIPKVAEKQEVMKPVPPPPVKEEPLPEVRPPVQVEKKAALPEKKEAAPSPAPSPPSAGETELSAIIKRLRESGRIEKGPASQMPLTGETLPKPGAPETAGRATETGPAITGEEPAAPAGMAGSARAAEVHAPEERVRVDLGKMMKRIKRLDITSIRRELQEGVELEPAQGSPEAPAVPAGEAGAPSPVPGEAPPAHEAKDRSDIDELKAFIQRLEVLEEPAPTPPLKETLQKAALKPPAAESPGLPPRRVPEPVPMEEKREPAREPAPAPVEEAEPVAKPAEEAPRPVEPDRKARIASLLRRSGLVKPPVEKEAEEPAPAIMERPAIPEEKVRPPAPAPAPAPAEEVEIRVPKPQRKRVEITRVPKRLEKPPREPPLIDERMIQRILKQPGVIAVSTFFEGFAVQSAGRADFEQVAANAEDLFRAGKKIAREIDIGPLNQIILETGKGKLIIAPHGDLNVCIFTEPDANLGLIRVALKGLQVEKD